MYEKVNPMHPDKIADRIAGALVDMAYSLQDDPRIAVEVLIGHGVCHIIAETSVCLPYADVTSAVERIAGAPLAVIYDQHPQDKHLADNQSGEIRCGDNGIFKGTPITIEQKQLTFLARSLYKKFPYDGKYLLDVENDKLIICQSNALEEKVRESLGVDATINPLGYWTGGLEVDSGATNRKLGSDMGDAVTGGGINSKDCSKADVSVNIYCHLKAQELGEPVEMSCAIGDTEVNGVPYSEIVKEAKKYIAEIGGFEALAEWGLIR